MTRKKLNLEYITDDRKRNTTFRKRKSGLIKKVDEISTLCGIEACAIVVDPNDPRPEIWPSRLEAQNVMEKFRRMPEVEQSRKMYDQESQLREMIVKAQEKLEKQREDNKKQQMTYLMHQFLQTGQISDNMGTNDLNNLSSFIDEKLKEVDQRINLMHAKEVVLNAEAQAMCHGQGSTSTMDFTRNDQHLSIAFANNVGGVLSFGDVNVPNSLWPNPALP